MRRTILPAFTAALLAFAATSYAADYYVDYENGSDGNPGTATAPFKHCPGSTGAGDVAATTELAPDDAVVFRGGVHYREQIEVSRSGEEGRPIVLDGNTAGTFGDGRAVIDGAEPLTGWTRCASAAECGGNPNWRNIYYADAPDGPGAFNINLCEGDRMLAIAQDPNTEDMFWDDDLSTFQPVQQPIPHIDSPVEITAGEGMVENKSRPYVSALDGSERSSAILDPCVGASLTCRFVEPVTVTSFGLSALPNYAMPKGFVLLADGRRVVADEMENERGLQTFPLPEPVRFTKLTLRVESRYPGERRYAALAELQGYNAEGENVLQTTPVMRYTDHEFFTQGDAHYWDGAYFVIYTRPSVLHKQKVLGFDPATDTISFEMLSAQQYPDRGRFTMMNSLRAIDRPGEYSLEETANPDGTRRVYVWPLSEAAPSNITYSARDAGITLNGASHVTVRGFRIQKQGGSSPNAFYARRGSNIVFQDNEVTLLRAGPGRSSAVGGTDLSYSVIDGNHIWMNSHCAGMILRRFHDSVAANNILHKNGSTAVDYYECFRSKLLHNFVTEHKGVHANGLTLYLGCRDVLVEGNRVADGNAAMTFQSAENLTIRNNILDGGGSSMAVGIWGGRPLRNVLVLNNSLVGSNPVTSWQTALFSNNRGIEGLIVTNNIIDGLASDYGFGDAVFSHNLYTRLGPDREDRDFAEGELYEPDSAKVFIDPEGDDYRLRPDSPAIDAGIDVGIERDIVGTPVPQGEAPDVGAHEYK